MNKNTQMLGISIVAVAVVLFGVWYLITNKAIQMDTATTTPVVLTDPKVAWDSFLKDQNCEEKTVASSTEVHSFRNEGAATTTTGVIYLCKDTLFIY